MRIFHALSVASMLALPVAAQAADVRLLELEPKADAAAPSIGVCDILHEIYPTYCQYWHVIAVEVLPAATSLKAGATLAVENEKGVEKLQVAWTGINYYLESGQTVLAVGDGQSSPGKLMDPGTHATRTLTSWEDRDQDGRLSVSDLVAVDGGKASAIVELRAVIAVSEQK